VREESSEESQSHMKLDKLHMTAVKVKIKNIKTGGTGSGYPIFQSIQLKPGTIVEIVE